jgi:hypothetical protein
MKTKPLLVSLDHHSEVMQLKAKLKLKTVDDTIGKLLEGKERVY